MQLGQHFDSFGSISSVLAPLFVRFPCKTILKRLAAYHIVKPWLPSFFLLITLHPVHHINKLNCICVLYWSKSYWINLAHPGCKRTFWLPHSHLTTQNVTRTQRGTWTGWHLPHQFWYIKKITQTEAVQENKALNVDTKKKTVAMHLKYWDSIPIQFLLWYLKTQLWGGAHH